MKKSPLKTGSDGRKLSPGSKMVLKLSWRHLTDNWLERLWDVMLTVVTWCHVVVGVLSPDSGPRHPVLVLVSLSDAGEWRVVTLLSSQSDSCHCGSAGPHRAAQQPLAPGPADRHNTNNINNNNNNNNSRVASWLGPVTEWWWCGGPQCRSAGGPGVAWPGLVSVSLLITCALPAHVNSPQPPQPRLPAVASLLSLQH